ncbi:MAG: hypothetical protein GWO38_27275 [Phycisphaerae bacterium]|nr:hypothetical protein [Phycisphaerae bacterium]NIX01490.1 hypothetical protein [Phycisphaerae bacterium]NIX31227.1 hypothetical protein [Phycisphaerae bacterium]
MKKWSLYIVAALILLFIVGPLLSRNSLITTNISYLPVSGWTKEKIVVVYFYFDGGADVPLEKIRQQFTYTDSLVILSDEQMMNRNIIYQLIGYNRPLFRFRINQYFFYAIIKNSSMAGEESLDNEVHYIWLPWGWYSIKSEITAAA